MNLAIALGATFAFPLTLVVVIGEAATRSGREAAKAARQQQEHTS